MFRWMHALPLLVLLVASHVRAEPRIHITKLPETCTAEPFSGVEGDAWVWVVDSDAPLLLAVEQEDEEYVAKFVSPVGERVLREKDCSTLMQAAAAIAPLLWQQIEDKAVSVTSVPSPVSSPVSSVSEAPSPTKPSEPSRSSSWFFAVGGLLSRGELPEGSVGIAMATGHRIRHWLFALGLEYTQATLALESPMEVVFSKLVLRPKGCARFRKGISWESCAAISVGVLRAKPSGQRINHMSSVLYLGVDASLGGWTQVASRYEVGLTATLSAPLLGRQYVFSPTPEVHVMRGLGATLLFALRYSFSDRF